jgi:hypothetical protein
MALAHGYALPFVTQKVVGDYASDNAAAAARAIASGGKKEAAGSCLDARAIDLQMRVPQRTDTNLLTNSAMAGATGSVLPTKWVSGSVNGLTVTISSAFTSAGFQAIDWTVSGTADSDGTIYIGCEPNDNTNAIPASIGQQYIGAMSLGKQAGTIPATMVMQVLGQKSSDGSVIETANSSTDLNGLVSGSLTRVNTAVLSIASVSSDRVNFRLTADVAALDVISFTIRIAAPQVERNDRISPYITTTTGAASRVTGQPSLLIVPQLTRAGVVYPQLPTVSGADFTFTRATTATRVNASGLIESVASGLLRLDYPVTGGCPAALIEASGTNLAPSGLVFNSAAGVLYDTAVSDSPAVSINSARITKNEASGTIRYASQNCSTSALAGSTTYTISRFFKYDGVDFATSMEYNNVAQWGGTSWNQLINIASSGVTLGTSTSCTGSVENYGNGWYRVAVRITTGASPSGSPVTYLMRLPAALSTGQGFLTALPQLETGAIPTSYIPTTTGSATRNAEVCSVSGVSGYIGQTEGTIYAEVDIRNMAKETYTLEIDDGVNANRIIIRSLTNNQMRGSIVATTSSGTIGISSATFTSGIVKIAFAYKSGDFALSVNGAAALTASGTFTFGASLNRITLGSVGGGGSQLNDRIRAAALYTTRLSNEQLESITRLN